jgi:hypothetical protein
MSDIFVSYASEDRQRVEPLVSALERQGWSVWWDHSIAAGQRWDHVIEDELKAAKCVLVVWTERSVRSEWVINEAADARQRGLLVPVCLDDVAVPLEFKRVQTASLVGWPGDAANARFQELVRGISHFVASAEVAREPLVLKEKPPRAAWYSKLGRSRHLVLLGRLTLPLVAGYILCYVTHWDVLSTVSATRGTAGCAGSGMIGNGSTLPEGGDAQQDARAIPPGLYVSKKVLPQGLFKYYKVLLKESEELDVNIKGGDQDGYGFATILPVDANPNRVYINTRGAQTTVSILPTKPGWAYFSIGDAGYVNTAGTIYGVCVK